MIKEPKWRRLAKPYVKAYDEQHPDNQLHQAGVYAILVDGNIAYIGQSKSLIWRLASHESAMCNVEDDNYKQPKYELLREAQSNGHQVQYTVLFYIPEEDIPLMNTIEANEIEKHQPPLNIIHPAINGRPQYKDNRVYTMDLPQFLSLLEGGNNDE